MSDQDRKLSWKEIDARRDGKRSQSDDRPKHGAAKERSEAATQQYLSEIDKLFTGAQGGAEGDSLAKAVRDAHGSADLDEACRAFREAVGMPRDVDLLSIFLDCKNSEYVVAALEALLELQRRGEEPLSRGVLSQLRILAQSFENEVAEIAEEILEQV